jgi:hypothetical protein
MKEATRTWARGPRLRVLAANCLIAAVAITGIAACGSTAAPSSSAAPKPKVTLTVTEVSAKGKTTKKWTLHCDPAGGAPRAAAACQALKSVKNPFVSPPAGTNCPMILANGPHYVLVGTWYGNHVSKTILDGGCTMGVWNKLAKVMY